MRKTHNIEDRYPLAPLQKGLLFHALHSATAGAYIQQLRATVTGLQGPGLTNAWKRIVERHSSLRTYFLWEGLPEPVQIVKRRVTVPYQELDWRQLSTSQVEEQFAQFLKKDRETGFDLTRAPLLRLTRIWTGDDVSEMIATSHHIIWDGWSTSIVMRELSSLVTGADGCEALAQPTCYRNYVEWIQEQNPGSAESYWRNALREISPAARIPGLGPVDDSHSTDTQKSYTLYLESSVTLRLSQFARSCGVTPNTVLAGAWALLLSCCNNREDVVFGLTISGRPGDLPGADDTVGLFINTLPLVARLNRFADLAAWLQDLQSRILDLQDHVFSDLLDIRKWSKSAPGHPLFESIVVFESQSVAQRKGSAAVQSPFSNVHSMDSGDFPLALIVGAEKEIRLAASYDSSRIGQPKVKILLERYSALLDRMLMHVSSKLSELTALSSAEASALAERSLSTSRDFGPPLCVHEMFDSQVAASPGSVALTLGTARWTYEQLNRLSTRLAAHLRGLGVQPDQRVGIYLHCPAKTIIAVLAVLKSGSAYVPLDPTYPRKTLDYMIADSGIQIVVTEGALTQDVPGTDTTIKIDIMQACDPPDVKEELPQVLPDNLAYVIYTSGSTGLPKGVAVSHRSLFNAVQWFVRYFKIDCSHRMLLSVSTSFDPSVAQMFSALTSGAELVCLEPKNKDASYILEVVADRNVNIVDFPPSILTRIFSDARTGQLRSVKQVLSGGEACPPALVETVVSRFHLTFSNLYGPTETCINASCWTSAHAPVPQRVSIGLPIHNAQIYLLDSCLQPVPNGVPGEIFIGGAGLARGYLNRPALTAEKFVPDPFAEVPGRRLFRTGDRGRFLDENGELEFLGRLDSQVKIRGLRIECGQVEAAIHNHPAVRDAIVAVRLNHIDEPVLAAYLSTTRRLQIKELRSFLKDLLPDYMIPSVLTLLDHIPTLPNGKVDRSALPTPNFAADAESAVQPRNEQERLLANIWCDLLHSDGIGVEDNFFALGGHSLTAIGLPSRVRSAFGKEVPVRLVFEKPTVSEYCRELRNWGEPIDAIAPVVYARVRPDGRAPMSFAQRRLWFLDRLAPGEPLYNIPEAFRLRGRLDPDALKNAVSQIVGRHEALRTTFCDNGALLQVISERGGFELEYTGLANTPLYEGDFDGASVVSAEAAAPFDLEQGPLLRTRLIKLADEDHIFLLTFHHLVADGQSVAIVCREVFAAYRAQSKQLPTPFSPLAVQYADFAAWQQERVADKSILKQLQYWKEQLSGAPDTLELPTDYPRPPEQTFRGASYSFAAPHEIVRLMKRMALQESATPFMIVLAAFSALLHRYSGEEDICIGSPVSGRDRPELDGVVGLFVNTIVLRTDCSSDPSFRELLRRVRSACISAFSNQDVPFEKIIEELNPARDLSRSPLFQVMFSYQHLQPAPQLDLDGLSATKLSSAVETSKFDLELSITESKTGFFANLEYRTDLFLPETIRRMARYFLNLLGHAMKDPECAVSRLSLFDADESRQLLGGLDVLNACRLPDLRLHECFESQAERDPKRIAVTAEDGCFSYRELNERANSIAHTLCDRGIGAESIVAVLSDRGALLLACMIGIWKAGATYLPLDPKYPAGRIAEILSQAHAEAIVVTPRYAMLIEPITAEMRTSVNLSVLSSENLLNHTCRYNPNFRVMSSSLAYVIFTSGSTGIPKGAMVEHAGMLNHLLAKIEDLDLGPADVVAQTASQCFDISLWQFLAPLVIGGQTHVCPDGVAANPELLLEDLPRAGVSVLEVVPTLLRVLIEEVDRMPGQTKLPDLRWLISTGEPLPPELAHTWLQRYPAIPIVNAYGPTECSDDVTHHKMLTLPEKTARSVPIGKPIRNTRLSVLDKHLQLVPLGVAGELFVGGAGVGRGYIENPAATAAAFCPDPFSSQPGSRLYRTGDRVKLSPDGTIDFIGRVDRQVKVRGFRIELGETEFTLRGYPAVRDCVLVVSQEAGRTTELIAYVVFHSHEVPPLEELRAFLKTRLPDYMVPSHFVRLEHLPLTPTGKIDRAALPAFKSDPMSRPPSAEPGTEIERRLVRLWKELLCVDTVGLDDNFFELGGHSILALQLMGKIQAKFGRKLSLAALFQHGTIRGLAGSLQAVLSESSSPIVALHTAGSNPPLFFVHVGSGEVVCYAELVRRLGVDQPFYGLQDPNLYSQSVTVMSIEERAALYTTALRTVQPRGPYLLGGWSFGGLVAFEMAKQLCASGEPVALLALLDTGSPEFVREMTDADDDAALLGIIARELSLSVEDAALRPLTLDQKYEFLSQRMKDAGFHWPDREHFLARQLLIFKSRNKAIAEYYPSPYDGRITFFRADTEYTEATPSRRQIALSATRGFEKLTSQQIDLHWIPGNHHQIAHEPGVKVLSERLRGCIAKTLLEFPQGSETQRAQPTVMQVQ